MTLSLVVTHLVIAVPGLDPGISPGHPYGKTAVPSGLGSRSALRTGMPGTRPGMTTEGVSPPILRAGSAGANRRGRGPAGVARRSDLAGYVDLVTKLVFSCG